jgi:hypothetical protein
MEVETEVPVPPQHTSQTLFDFRHMAHGPRGYKCANKRKLDDYEDQVPIQIVTPFAHPYSCFQPYNKTNLSSGLRCFTFDQPLQCFIYIHFLKPENKASLAS